MARFLTLEKWNVLRIVILACVGVSHERTCPSHISPQNIKEIYDSVLKLKIIGITTKTQVKKLKRQKRRVVLFLCL